MEKRRYRQNRRAEQTRRTRRHIVEAAMALHEELGPAATSLKAVAERAGVQRLTLYRHFPDDTALFQACTSHWLSLHPPPEPEGWNTESDPWKRCRKALRAFYGYYRDTERMWFVTYRDVEDVPALQGPLREFEDYVAGVRDGLIKDWKVENRTDKSLSLTVRHGLKFSTWASLKEEGLGDEAMTRLVMSWI